MCHKTRQYHAQRIRRQEVRQPVLVVTRAVTSFIRRSERFCMAGTGVGFVPSWRPLLGRTESNHANFIRPLQSVWAKPLAYLLLFAPVITCPRVRAKEYRRGEILTSMLFGMWSITWYHNPIISCRLVDPDTCGWGNISSVNIKYLHYYIVLPLGTLSTMSNERWPGNFYTFISELFCCCCRVNGCM